MRATFWRGKKSINRWEMEKKLNGQIQRLKQIRPLSCDPDWIPPTLNPNKKLRLQQDKYTQIERQNRYLLEKIATTMNKKSQKDKDKERLTRSLNANFRKRQLQTIEVENARLLKRLQDKKSDYDSQKLKMQWKKQKQVIKNIAFYPFILKTSFRQTKRRASSRPDNAHATDRTHSSPNKLTSDIEIVRIRKIDNENFVVTLQLNPERLLIIADQKKNVDNKIISIPKEEALAFIECECEGKLQGIFDRLSYDAEEDVLYLIGNGGEDKLTTIREKKEQLEEDKSANI